MSFCVRNSIFEALHHTNTTPKKNILAEIFSVNNHYIRVKINLTTSGLVLTGKNSFSLVSFFFYLN